MPRLHLFELEDLPWFPAPVRDAGTNYLQLMIDLSDPYAPAARLLADALRRRGAEQIVDLCSGGGGPWRRLRMRLADAGVARPIHLTDRFPNPGAAASVATPGASAPVTYLPTPIEATRVPASLPGFRTMFSAFHHFAPEQARAVLSDAVAGGHPIAIFEATKRNAADRAPLRVVGRSRLLPAHLRPAGAPRAGGVGAGGRPLRLGHRRAPRCRPDSDDVPHRDAAPFGSGP